MNKTLAILGLASASILFANTAAASISCTPTQSFTPNSNYSASYTVCGGALLSMTITANTTGWVAVGFSNDQLMTNTDMVTGGVNADGTLYLNDRFAINHGAPAIDATQNATPITQTSSESNGVTTLTFTRLLNTGDTTGDFNLTNGSYYLLWAYGSSDTFGRHTARGASASPISFTAPVPVPAAAWLFGSGLLGLLSFKSVAKKARA
jgi:hypothetical protein